MTRVEPTSLDDRDHGLRVADGDVRAFEWAL
jgi:hypothetical protein